MFLERIKAGEAHSCYDDGGKGIKKPSGKPREREGGRYGHRVGSELQVKAKRGAKWRKVVKQRQYVPTYPVFGLHMG